MIVSLKLAEEGLETVTIPVLSLTEDTLCKLVNAVLCNIVEFVTRVKEGCNEVLFIAEDC